MFYKTICAIFLATLTTACAGLTGDRVVVDGAGPDELLKLRSGPSLGFGIIMGLPDGTELYQHGCVTEVGQRWCEVSLVRTPQVTGFVSADYITPL